MLRGSRFILREKAFILRKKQFMLRGSRFILHKKYFTLCEKISEFPVQHAHDGFQSPFGADFPEH